MKEEIREILQDKLSIQEWPNCGQPYTSIDGWDIATSSLHRLFIEKQVEMLEQIMWSTTTLHEIHTILDNLKKELEKWEKKIT